MRGKFTIKSGVGKRLKEERNRLGLSQEALAEKLGCSKVTLYFYERERTNLDVPTLVHLSEAGINLSYLLGAAKVDEPASADVLSIDQLVVAFPTLLEYVNENPEVAEDARAVRALLTGIALGHPQVQRSPRRSRGRQVERRVRA